MKGLRSARLSHNRIDDAHRYAFSNKELHDLDLSHNEVRYNVYKKIKSCEYNE